MTPQVDLWKTSGHFDFYGENMFDQMKVENEEYQLRPMNCPFHIAIYKARCLPACLILPAPPGKIPPASSYGACASAEWLFLIQGSSSAMGRARHRVPLRAVRHNARPVPCARVHAGGLRRSCCNVQRQTQQRVMLNALSCAG